jgi:hypothetical protein
MSTKICITPEQEKEIKAALKKQEFSISKLNKTKSSSERFELVNKYLDNEEVSKKVVREIEKRLNSKKEDIVSDYIERTLKSVPEETRKGVLNRFKRMSKFLGAKEEKDFLEELVAHKFGAYITKEEANNFEKLTNEAIALKEKIPTNAIDITPESLAYGDKVVELANAEARILVKRAGFDIKDYQKFKGQKGWELTANWSKYLLNAAIEGSGAARAFKATADFSATFRQLWKIFSSGLLQTVYSRGADTRKLKIWWNAVKATKEAVSQTRKYGDERAYDAIRAQIYAHPNSYNGVFDAAKNGYGLNVGKEEIFPSSVPSDLYDKYASKFRLGKGANIFKISEVAYNATVLKARFDLANLTIKTLQDSGANVMDKNIADAAGEFVSAFTGRAGLGKLENAATEFNKLIFAPRFAMSQFSPYIEIFKGLTTRADNPAARLAMQNNLQFLAGTFILLIAAESIRGWITGDETDYRSVIDPRSNRFGKVLFPGTNSAIDFTGGNRSVLGLFGNLASKKYYDARLGVWRQKNIMQLSEGKPIWDFATSKFAPVPALIRDRLRGEHFGGKEVTGQSIVSSLLVPITVGNVLQETFVKEDLSTAMLVLAGEGSGLSVSDVRFKPSSDEWRALLNSDEKAYWRAVGELWESVHGQVVKLRSDKEFQTYPRDKQVKILEHIYNGEMKRVINQNEYRSISKEKLQKIEAEKEKEKTSTPLLGG